MAEAKEKELYRVFVTDIPKAVTGKYVENNLNFNEELPGKVVSVNTQGCNTCAVVTMECDEGLSKGFKETKIGCMVVKNWGIFNATLSLENVPEDVRKMFSQFAPVHDVLSTYRASYLRGSIDSLYNLCADVDISFLMKEQEKKFESARPGGEISEEASVEESGYSGLASTPKPNSSILPSNSASSCSPDRRSPLRPSILDNCLAKLTPISQNNTATSVPSSAIAVSSMHGMTVPPSGDNPVASGVKVRDTSRAKKPSHEDTTKGSGAAPKTMESSPPLLDTSSETKGTVFGGLYPDALALVQRLPEGNIPGVEYHVQEGIIQVTVEGKKKIEETVSKFQDVYKKLFSPGQQLRVENIQVPPHCSMKEVKREITTFEQRYVSTAFVLDQEKRVVRVISQSRQLDQAKKFLEEALKHLACPSSPASSPCAPVVIKFSGNRTLTLKKGDLVKEKADILVNAANGHLNHAGGVARALNVASNGELQRRSDMFMQNMQKGKAVQTGIAVWTHGGGGLACNFVIHAVGPEGSKHSPQQSEHLLKQVVQNTLKTAERLNASSIVFPAISCGVFKVNRDLVAYCIIDTILGYSYTKRSPSLSDIRIVIIDEPSYNSFAQYFDQIGGGHSARSSLGAAATPTEESKNKDSLKMPLSNADLDWIMPIIRHAAPKWRHILLKFGVSNDTIMKLMKQSNDEFVLLNFGMLKLVKQSTASPGITLTNLVIVLQSPDVGEEDMATNLIKAAVERKGETGDNSSVLKSLTYPNLDAAKSTETPSGCPICLEAFIKPVETKCNHVFCKECLQKCLKHSPYCPTCKTPLRTITGNQPPGGTMKYSILQKCVPGYEDYNTIRIEYNIPGGIQGPEHPNPGQRHSGTFRTAYLPNNHEGWEIFLLLQKAFQARMMFTIGTSVTSGMSNMVVWNDIHHKTSISGGPYGYPDPTYLQRVKEDLATKGITPDTVL